MSEKKYRPLGKEQASVLAILMTAQPRFTYDHWDDRAGWTWGSPSQTDRICRSLAKRGLVEHLGDSASGMGRYRAPLPKPS